VLVAGLLCILKPAGYRNKVLAIFRDIGFKRDLLLDVVPQLVKQVTGALRLRVGVVELAL
jgi:hypothetical protein